MNKKGFLILVLVITLVTAICYFFTDIVIYLFISISIAFILRPLVNFLDLIKIGNIPSPRWLMIIISYSFLVFIIYSFASLFVPLIQEQQAKIEVFNEDDINEFLVGEIDEIEGYLIDRNIMDQSQKGEIFTKIQKAKESLIANISPKNVLGNVVSFTGSVLVTLLAVLFISFFILLEKGKLTKLVLSLVPNAYFELTVKAIYQIKHLLSNYLLGLLVQMLSICTLVYIGLSIVGVNYALTIAVFAAVINVVPYLGPLIGSLFGIIIGLTTTDISSVIELRVLFLKIITVFAVVQLNDNIVLQPVIFSKSVKVHPVEIFIIIFAGASLGGIVGMVAAIPAYTVLRVSVLELLSGYKEYNVFRLNVSK